MERAVRSRPEPARPTTMRDIARVAGVSQSTVSRILNGVPVLVPVAEQTRERVLAAAAELGYRPNPLARALRGAKTMLLGVVVRDITDLFFASAIEARTLGDPVTPGATMFARTVGPTSTARARVKASTAPLLAE